MTDIETKEITLDRVLLRAMAFIGGSEMKWLREPKVDAYIDSVTGHLRLTLYGYVWGKNADDIFISYPSDWWQAIKDRWLPKWAKKRWPVRETVHHIKAAAMFPDLQYEVKDYKMTLALERFITEKTEQE